MESTRSLEQRLIEQAVEAVIYANREGTIERWNAAAERMFGFSAAEALGQNLDLIIPEHLRKAHWVGYDRAMETGRTRLGGQARLTRGLHKSGQKLYVEMSFAMVVDDDGAPLGSLAIARDATERVEREKAAAAAAAAASAGGAR